MAGIDELGLTGTEVDAQQLPGGVTLTVVDQCLVGPVGLLGQAGSRAAGAAQGADQDDGGQGAASPTASRTSAPGSAGRSSSSSRMGAAEVGVNPCDLICK
ncbi:hypothetical protein STAFG_3853 [Streptomyces afghaniensis 772]|uniref:Uncharacterized protein n=1 Tax=Streptomyces afghaniensis 772 TaxID=1283301 RepID=S4MR20_9ACTN|nr:hypothetical protein STAFG_3853 [Streptomyces afghaniensis 772]